MLGLAALAASLLASAAPVRAEAPGDACFPACRSGFLCHEGRCISACNPPCSAGETCTSAGECVAPAPKAEPAAFLGEPTPTVAATPDPTDAGWARGAFYFGAGAAAIDVTLTALVLATNPQDASAARDLGALSIVFFGVTTPLIALGGGSARNHPSVTGHPNLRVASWIACGLTLADAAWLLLRSHKEVIGDGWVASVGVLGTFSALGFTIDARTSASQAERLRGTPVSSHPALGLATGTAGGLVPTWGWGGRF
jgi:hypothetical protein